MTQEMLLTFLVLAGAVALFVSEKLPPEVVAMLVLAALLTLRLVTTEEALSGFSSPATVTVAAMFVLSAGLQRSGSLNRLGEAIARIRWGWLLALVMIVLTAAVSAFINNTAAVAVFLPLIIAAAVANNLPPSKFLIPLSYAAQFGGVCTLIGTSTNLLVDSMARQAGHAGFTIFEFSRLGIVFVVVGTVYLMIARRFLLPDLGVPHQADSGHAGRYVAELLVSDKSGAVGKRASDLLPHTSGDVVVLELFRGRTALPAPRDTLIEPGDRMLVRGAWPDIDAARRKLKLKFDEVARGLEDAGGDDGRVHAEAMVAPGSHLIGHTLAGLRFAHVYHARVQGLHRHRLSIRQPLDQVPLAMGDVFLLDAPESALDLMRADPGLVLLAERPQQRSSIRRALLALGILTAVVAVAAAGWMSIVASAIFGCVALILLRVLEPEDAYAAIDWRVVLLLAGVLPLGIALQNSGAAALVADFSIDVVGGFGPVATLAVIYILTSVLTEIMSNNASAALVVPIAIATAESLGLDSKPFLVAVAFAASTSFATPISYQTNTMVYAAGGYRFQDFLKVGLPLNVIFIAMAIVLIPRYFPFSP
ncbi:MULTISPECIES: SLC13 family permease [unclassified Luteimonas]|uniref:SLC13 family permease n=1 Tax=unclassified Luteimonas TaxID=2629088 RepID=UPI001603978F|nr:MULTISPECIES: SLC13 family permease [unclassified Luteimonas]MBB1473526.1 SLC13 family permease [Luteimonas sp. MC1782]MBB6600258.1 SLC13 family permease [Luteimonas sp. MC1825]QOC87941.1 SLC13 family permease [Luteimonas sp. MC1825]